MNSEFAYNNRRFARLSNTPSGRDVIAFEDKFLKKTVVMHLAIQALSLASL